VEQTAIPRSVAARTLTFTGPPLVQITSFSALAAANTRAVNGAICVTITSASRMTRMISSSLPDASSTSATGSNGTAGQGSTIFEISHLIDSTVVISRSRRSFRTKPSPARRIFTRFPGQRR
jgi:hypothetical protein